MQAGWRKLCIEDVNGVCSEVGVRMEFPVLLLSIAKPVYIAPQPSHSPSPGKHLLGLNSRPKWFLRALKRKQRRDTRIQNKVPCRRVEGDTSRSAGVCASTCCRNLDDKLLVVTAIVYLERPSRRC